MPLPDFDTLAPVQSKSALPDFDSLKPYVPSAPRFDPSKIQLDPYQDYYKKTGLTEPASENFQSWQSRQPPEKSALGPATGIGALTGLDRAKYFIQTKLEKVFPGMAEKGSPSPASVVGGAAMVAPLGLPETLGKLLLGYFAYRTAAAQPDIYRQIKSEIQSGNYSEAQRTAVEDLLQMGMIGTGAAGLRKPAPQFQGPLATGEVLQRPPGAIPEPPPDLGPIPGVPTHGIPTPSIPDPSYPKNRPVVPGTAAEPRETAVETIRRAQATTKEQIQQLFPKANLSRQQAAAWRDLAWGKPSTLNPQPSTPTPNARQIQTPAAVYGDLRPQPISGPGQVPVPESGGRIQPQAEGRLPETPPGQVPLSVPAADQIKQIVTLPPAEFGKQYPNYTHNAFVLGAQLKPEDVPKLKELATQLEAQQSKLADAAQSMKDSGMDADTIIQDLMNVANQRQFISEALQKVPTAEKPAVTVTAIADTRQHQAVDFPINKITLSKDVPNFKENADPETGIVPGERLTGKYQRLGTAPIVIWERLNGAHEIITGRHRFDLAKRSGETTIPVQIVREADGFTTKKALTFDAEANIRDGQGSLEDYAHYFKNTPDLTEAEARTRGLLDRVKGQDAFRLARSAADDLYSLWADDKIATEKAVAIARAAPGNADLQALGIKQAFKGRSPDEIENFIKAVQTQPGGTPEQVDLFGRDDTAIKQAEEMAARATEQQSQIAEQIRAVQGAVKRPELARKLGVDVRDPEGVTKRIGELKADLDRWRNWPLHPDLVAEVGGKPVTPAPAAPPSKAAPGELFGAGEVPFNLTGQETKMVPPKTEQTSFGNERLTQNELFAIQEVVASKDPEKSANAMESQFGAAQSVKILENQLAVIARDPNSYKSYTKPQRAMLQNVLALLRQRADLGPGLGASRTGEGKTLGFGGTAGPSTLNPQPSTPAATTPQQLASLQKTMMPGFAAGVREGVLSLLLPSAKSPAHLRAAEKFGARLGAMNQRAESTAFALRGPGKVFDRLGVHNEKLPPDKNPGIKFMSDMSQGRKLRHPFEHVSDLVQKLFDDRLTKLAEAGAPLQSVRENYFPGMWTRESRLAFNAALDEAQKQGVLGKDSDVNNATPAQKAWVKSRVDQLLKSGQGSEADMMAYFTRRPLKGQESFRKQKVFDDVMTGAEFGLRPLSNNPIDLVKWKLAEMDRSIMANEFFQQLKTDGELKVINPYEDTPAGWVRLKDKYGTIYGPPTVTIPEHLDKAVYEGLLDFAGKLGIKHQRSMKFPPGPGNRALGLSYQGQDFVRTRFATETSVLAHEIGHQLDKRHDFWNKFVTEAVGLGKKGVQTKGASQKQRGLIKTELRNIADLTGSRGGDPRKKEEQIAQMVEAYVHAPEKMREVAPTVFKVFDDFIHSKPELKGLADIKPGIELEKLTSDKYVGLPIKGYRIVPKATGDIVNNYLSSSLYNSPGLGGLYKAWMGTANALNQSQLGLGSAFHAGFTTGDVQVSAGATLIKDVYGVLRGNRSLSDLGGTVKNWTTASVKTALTGDKVLNAWRDPDGVIDPRIAQVVKATELAGGGYKLEHGMQTEQTTKMLRDWYSGSRLKAAGRSPIALTELMMKPIMDFLVPRQKAGVFADLAWRIIDQNAGKPLEELTPQFRQAWNRVDARLGQVRYDRLFANNTAKGMVQALVRAPGWSGGTIAELGGSFPDAANFFKEWIKTGRLPDNIPDRVAYIMSLLATVGTANAVLTYAFTGQTPTGMDFLAFRTGRKDKDGNNERFMLPTYVKDLLAYSKQPGTTVLHKSTPLASVLGDVLNNRDYYGYEIRNPNDPYVKQAGQAGKYVIKSFEPFWIQGAVKAAQAGVSPGRLAAPYVGVMPAPAYITRSSIQNQISDLYHKRTGERLKPYGTQEADAAKRVAHQTGAMDVYMFHHLPKTDQAALAQKMSAGEKEHYGVGQSSATATATRRAAPWAVQGP